MARQDYFTHVEQSRTLCETGGPRGRVLRTLTAVGSSLARVYTCETSKVLLAGGQVVYLGDIPFSHHLTIDSAQNE